MTVCQNKIKIILITGFLGAGKTTLLNRILEHYKNQKFGLIVNDFGKIAVDGTLISEKMEHESSDEQLVEIANGSIFCSCLSSVFVDGLKHFSRVKPEFLFIETSGLSDPSSFDKILKDFQLQEEYEILSSICLVDAVKTLKLLNVITIIQKQIQYSNIILLNKSADVDSETLEKLSEKIVDMNQSATQIRTNYCEIDFDLLNDKKFQKSNDSLESCNTPGSRLCSILLEQKNINELDLQELLLEIIKHSYRIKGYYRINDKTFYFSDNNGIIEKKEVQVYSDYGINILSDKNQIFYIKSLIDKLG